MELPSYFLPRPALDLDEATVAAFEHLFASTVSQGADTPLVYTLSAPKWQFLCYLTDCKDIVLHGTGNPAIAQFEPRQSNDVDEFGNRCAVYAASDGLWPIYFAIIDRDNHPTSLINGCFRVVEKADRRSDPFYFFSISRTALQHQPWRTGMIYLLPRKTFEQQPPEDHQGMKIHIGQWASIVPVTPLAKLPVGPEDFPFLSQIRGHDDEEVFRRAAADPDAFPWLDEDENDKT